MTDDAGGPDPRSMSWHSRSSLLQAQADAETELSGRYNAAWPVFRVAIAAALGCLGLVIAGFAIDRAVDGSGGAADVVLAVLVLAALAVWPARVLADRLRRREDVVAAIAAWRDLDATDHARALPADDPPAELRTPWDARFDPDFDAVVSRNAGTARVAMGSTGSILRSVLGGVGLGAGLVLVLIAGASLDRPVFAVACLLAGLLALAVAGSAAWAAARHAYGAQVRENRMAAERLLIEAMRSARGFDVGGPPPTVNPAAKVVVGVLFALVLVVVGIRVASASPAALAIVAGLLVVSAVALTATWARQRASDADSARRVSERLAEPSQTVVGGVVRRADYGLTIDRGVPGALVVGATRVSMHGTDVDNLVTVSMDEVETAVAASASTVRRRGILAVVLKDGSVLLLWSRFHKQAASCFR